MSPLLLGASAAPLVPPPGTQRDSGASGTERGGGVDVIGADAAVSSIMDGDDADGGAKPALRGERNKNGEEGEEEGDSPGCAHAHIHIHTHTHTQLFSLYIHIVYDFTYSNCQHLALWGHY